MTLAITVCATQSYRYAMRSQAERVRACLSYAHTQASDIVLVGDSSIEEVAKDWSRTLRQEVRGVVMGGVEETGANYKQDAQLRIARMRTRMTTETAGADHVWTLDSDVLPPPNALASMQGALAFDRGYYQVAFCTYPNDLYLGGLGLNEAAVMAPNIYEDERDLPPEVKAEGDSIEKEFKALAGQPVPQPLVDRMSALRKLIDEAPAKGNVFALNAQRWRRRGWLEFAYPGIGLGAMVQSDWSGFGCNLMTRRAADLCDWTGYNGEGTEDVFINAFRWAPLGVRIACVTHAPCSHVLRRRKKDATAPDAYELLHAHHEMTGESRGHLRTRRLPWTPEF